MFESGYRGLSVPHGKHESTDHDTLLLALTLLYPAQLRLRSPSLAVESILPLRRFLHAAAYPAKKNTVQKQNLFFNEAKKRKNSRPRTPPARTTKKCLRVWSAFSYLPEGVLRVESPPLPLSDLPPPKIFVIKDIRARFRREAGSTMLKVEDGGLDADDDVH